MAKAVIIFGRVLIDGEGMSRAFSDQMRNIVGGLLRCAGDACRRYYQAFIDHGIDAHHASIRRLFTHAGCSPSRLISARHHEAHFSVICGDHWLASGNIKFELYHI